jgi:transcriptional regulator with XRE-family HTH domain
MDMLASRLRARRKALGLTQRRLAELAGTDQSHISRLEQGRKGATTAMLHRIAQALSLSLSELLGDWVQEDVDEEYAPGHPVRDVLDDPEAPAGLRSLALDGKLCEALRINSEEWRLLRSIALPSTVGKEGYVQLLITVRAITIRG